MFLSTDIQRKRSYDCDSLQRDNRRFGNTSRHTFGNNTNIIIYGDSAELRAGDDAYVRTDSCSKAKGSSLRDYQRLITITAFHRMFPMAYANHFTCCYDPTSIPRQDTYDSGFTDIRQHRIVTGDDRPVRQRLRQCLSRHQQYIDEEVQKMLDADVIEPARSEWASNVCLAKKADFGSQLTTEMSLPQFDTYPLPSIDDCLDALNGSSWLSTIDIRSGFWQVAQHPDDSCEITFIHPERCFQGSGPHFWPTWLAFTASESHGSGVNQIDLGFMPGLY